MPREQQTQTLKNREISTSQGARKTALRDYDKGTPTYGEIVFLMYQYRLVVVLTLQFVVVLEVVRETSHSTPVSKS